MKHEKNNDFIISSYAFDLKGVATSVSSKEIAPKLKSRRLAWVHLDANDKNAKPWLEENVPYLDHLIIDALFADETRPRIMEFKEGMLVILRGANSKEKNKDSELSSIRLWIDQFRIISIQKRFFLPIVNLMNEIESGVKKIPSAGEFLFHLINDINICSNSIIADLDAELDETEDEILGERKSNLQIRDVLSGIRKQTTIFKRYMIPQKDVISRLQNSQYSWIDQLAIRHFQESYNNICHLIEEIDEIKERSQIIHQELSNLSADKIKKTTFKISLIASIFLPLSFVTGLFGMNVGGIPLANDTFGFYIVSYFLIVIFGGLYFLLKNRGDFS